MSPASGSSTAAANRARRRSTETMLTRVRDAVNYLHRCKLPLTVAAVARRAEVSRTFLYTNPDARTLLQRAGAAAAARRTRDRDTRDADAEMSWRERAFNAEDGLKAAHQEISSQRRQIAELMGQVRDLQQHWDDQTIARIMSENTDLKRRIRTLDGDNRDLTERLQAARSNGRFADRRIAQLEAGLLQQPPPPG